MNINLLVCNIIFHIHTQKTYINFILINFFTPFHSVKFLPQQTHADLNQPHAMWIPHTVYHPKKFHRISLL